MKRYFVLPAAVIIQTCLGGVYAWSSFVPCLYSDYSLSSGSCQMIFGITIATFAITMVFAGRKMDKWGARIMCILCGILFLTGYVVASASRGLFPWLVAGFSVIGGAAIGFGYVSSLSNAVKWFPKHKGLVSGIAVAGFGAGAIILSNLAEFWLENGWSVLRIFRVIGISYGVTICACALLLFKPPEPEASGNKHLRPISELLQDRIFRALAFGLFCGTFAGLLVIGNLKPIGIDSGLEPGFAAIAISIFAIGNGLGRIGWGWVSDRLHFLSIPLSLLFLGVSLIILLIGRTMGPVFLASALLTGAGFGACFVVYVSVVASRYGQQGVGGVYPLVFLAYGVAAITGPPTGGKIFDVTDSYTGSIIISIVIVFIGAAILSRKNLREK